MKFRIASQRFKSVTLFGAIGTGLQESFVYMTAPKTTIETVTEFIELLSSKISPNSSKPTLVLDKHSAHMSKRVLELIR